MCILKQASPRCHAPFFVGYVKYNTESPQTHYQGIVFVRGVKRVYVVNTVDTIRVPPAWKLRSIISLYVFLFQLIMATLHAERFRFLLCVLLLTMTIAVSIDLRNRNALRRWSSYQRLFGSDWLSDSDAHWTGKGSIRTMDKQVPSGQWTDPVQLGSMIRLVVLLSPMKDGLSYHQHQEARVTTMGTPITVTAGSSRAAPLNHTR